MITCNRCGNVNPVNAVMCQKCGTPLVDRVESESGQSRVGREQQELPAWLESLRASGPPVPSVNNPANFHAADIVDEENLPSWMRSHHDVADNPPSNPYPALRASSMSAPNTDMGRFAEQRISAGSLIDEQALPQWLQQDKQASAPQQGIDASSLVQPDDMPEWMKTMQPQNSTPAHPALPGAGMAAPPSGFLARDLIDQSSLPAWLSQQGGQETANQAHSGREGAPGPAFSASSLLDMNSVPRWLRDIDKGQQTQSNQLWQGPQPPMQGAPTHNPAMNTMPADNLSAGSFTDASSLPNWLHEGNEQRQAGIPAQQGPVAPGYQSGQRPERPVYSAPPRTGSVRVPNRPRTEVEPTENSEAAASDFASMLGVASVAPRFPAPQNGMQAPQWSQAGYAPMQQGPQPQMGGARPGQAAAQGFTGPQPFQSPYGPGYNSDYPGGFQGPVPGPMPQQGVYNSSVGVSIQGETGEQEPTAKKRGFFEFFRSWFSRL